MSLPPFGDRLAAAVNAVDSPVGVGLDPHLSRLPLSLQQTWLGLEGRSARIAAALAVSRFNEVAIEALVGVVAAVKPQVAFYEALGAPGWEALEAPCAAARAAGLLVVVDAKRGDIASTAAAYAQALLAPDGPVAGDALTVNPWMGGDTIEPYLPTCDAHGRGLFVLVRTTNPGSAELQGHGTPTGAMRVAGMVGRLGAARVGASGTSSIGAVVGAMSPTDARVLRSQMPAAWFLVPGVGAQGGSIADALAGLRPDGLGALVMSSREVLFGAGPPAQDLDQARVDIGARARSLANRLRAAREAALGF